MADRVLHPPGADEQRRCAAGAPGLAPWVPDPLRSLVAPLNASGPTGGPLGAGSPERGRTKTMRCRGPAVARTHHFMYRGENYFRGFFLWPAKIGGGGDLVLLLRNEGKIWCKAPCCCILVDGCRHFLVHAGWSLSNADGLWMLAVASCWDPCPQRTFSLVLATPPPPPPNRGKFSNKSGQQIGDHFQQVKCFPVTRIMALAPQTHCPFGCLIVVSSMLRLHTACSAQKTPPAAHAWCTHFDTLHP